MTDAHRTESTPRPSDAEEPPPAASILDSIGSNIERPRVLLLGANAWLVACLWPLLFMDGPSTVAALAAASPLLALALGCAALPAGSLGAAIGRVNQARVWLLLVFPVGMACVVALREEALNQRALGPVALTLAVVSLLAYGAGAAHACQRPARHLERTHGPLDAEPWDGMIHDRRLLQRLVVAMVMTGALAVGVIAPSLGGFEALRSAWGEAALEGGLLTAVVAGSVAVAAAAVFLGSALRVTDEPDEPRHDWKLRVSTLLLLALMGAVAFLVLQPE